MPTNLSARLLTSMPTESVALLAVIAITLSTLNACTRSASETLTPAEQHQRVVADTEISRGISFNGHILVDQFGYRPKDNKVAVIRDPVKGFDQNDKFNPSSEYQVRSAIDGKVVLSGQPKVWNNGTTQASSGDRGWWFDFSSLETPGKYFVYDIKQNSRSSVFNISNDVYKQVLKAAMRTYYYQRSGLPKKEPYAQACWTDEASYARKGQDQSARDITDRDNDAKVRDLSGGWFDAGDTNKYVTFALQPVNQLLTAYEQSPQAFGDDFDIPESGNGIPDVVDEVKWEVDWLLKMQYPNGSLALKVGAVKNVPASPPSSDSTPRFYVPSCTSSTIAGASMFAHAAHVFASFPKLKDQADVLVSRATLAWRNYQNTPNKQTNCDTNIVLAGDADRSIEDQQAVAVEAAIYLFAVTRDPLFERYVQTHYREMKPYRDIGWSRYDPDQGDALIFYSKLDFADKELAKTILTDRTADIAAGNGVYGFVENDDLYRAFLHDPQYHWGSSNPRANYGNSNLDVSHYRLEVPQPEHHRQRALEILHYFHGVNPFAMVYLSNMYQYGATRSANEIFHTWFQANTKWSNALTSVCGPPPGYLPGGPNANAAKDGVPTTLQPPTGQPPQKSYRDWNTVWPDSSWAVTEPAIYFQSAYVKLLSSFVENN
jgi:endoglucanase